MSQLTSEALQLRLEVTDEDLNTTLTQLTQLKVFQLKELCKSIGLTQKGKKQDLIDRLHQFISNCARTRERGSLLLAARTIVLKVLNNDPVPNFSSLCNVLSTGLIDNQLLATLIARLQNSVATGSGPGQRKEHLHNGLHMATSNMRSSHSTQLSAYYPKYQGPMLLFQSTIFYTLRRMVHGFPYVMTASMGRNVCNVPVHLDNDEVSALQLSSTAKVYFFCALSSTPNPNRADIQFPPIEIYVDGVNTKQYVKGLKGKAGTCRPADLTSYIKNINRQFTINIVYSDAAEPYIVYLYIVDSRTPEDITKMIVDSLNFIPTSITKEMIRREYELNQDDDIVMATSSISLRCPLSYARMTYPVKSIQCDHIQCFDALSFLSMQERIPSWICPVCSTKINQQLLALSKYMEEILHSTSEDVDTVMLNPDGSWTVAEEGAENAAQSKEKAYSKPDTSIPTTSTEPVNSVDDAIEIISLGSDSEDEHEEVTIGAAPPEPHTNNTSFAMRRFSEEPSNSLPIITPAEGTTTSSDGVSIMTAELVDPTAHDGTQLQGNILVRHDTSMTLESADVSSDDEPIQSYGRRRNHIIEDSVTNSESPSSHTALNDIAAVLTHDASISVHANPSSNDVVVTRTLQLLNPPTHEEREREKVTKSTLHEGSVPVSEAVTDVSSDYSSGMNNHQPTQMEKIPEAEKTTSRFRDVLNMPQRAENSTPLLQHASLAIGTAANIPAQENAQQVTSGSLPLPNNRQEVIRNDSRIKNIADLSKRSLNPIVGTNAENQGAPDLLREPHVSTTNGGSSRAQVNHTNDPDANTQEGSIISTIQNMFSRSASPQLTATQPHVLAADVLQIQKDTSVPQQIPGQQMAPQTSQLHNSDRSSSSDHIKNVGYGYSDGLHIHRDISTASRQMTEAHTQNGPVRATFHTNNGQVATGHRPLTLSGPLGNGNSGISKADAYRKTVQNTSQLISLYRQMEGVNSQDPMESHATRRAQISTDGTISFTPSIPASTSIPSGVAHQSQRTSSWNTHTSLALSPHEARTRSVPTIPTHTQGWLAIPGATPPGPEVTGVRYSRSPFDALRQAEQEKQKIRGILDIEVAHDVILPWNSPSRSGKETPNGGNENHINQNSSVHTPAQLNAGSRLLYNLPTLNRTSSTPVMPRANEEFSTSSPIGKKRSISGSSQPEKTWNKRLNKQKFNPSEINAGQVIELDD